MQMWPSRITSTAAFLLAVFLTTGGVLAVDQPPQEPEQQAPGSSGTW